MRAYLLLGVFLITIALPLRADEPTRRAQEELRKRNLYFGDINGRTNPELIEAIKRYQTRKGFNSSGELDEETASSLKIEIAETKKAEPLPDVPVLKSDSARALAEPDRAALQPEIEQAPAATPTPVAPPAESPTKSEQSIAERITDFIQRYLHAGESDDVDRQISYFAFPVQYFDHGKASRDFVIKDTRNYVNRWPQRKYTLLGPVKFLETKRHAEYAVEFTINFDVRNGNRAAHGKTRNLWTIQSDQENFKILVINEQRLHD